MINFFELVMRMRKAQRSLENNPTPKQKEICRILEYEVDGVLTEQGYIHRYYRLPSLYSKSTAICEIVKCKLGNWWQLNVIRKNGRRGRYSNIKDFPLRRTYKEVRQDLADYFVKLKKREKRKAAKAAKADVQGIEGIFLG